MRTLSEYYFSDAVKTHNEEALKEFERRSAIAILAKEFGTDAKSLENEAYEKILEWLAILEGKNKGTKIRAEREAKLKAMQQKG